MNSYFSRHMAPLVGLFVCSQVSWASVPPETLQIEGARIIKEAKNLILKNWKEEGLEVQIDVVKDVEDTFVPSADIHWEIQWNGAKPFSGLMSLPVVYTQNGHVIKRVMLVVKTKLFRQVLVPVKNIERHSLLKKEYFTLARAEIASHSDHYIDDVSVLLNKRALRRLPLMTPVVDDYIEELPLVRKGESVTIRHHLGSMEIEVKGVAKMDGRMGDHIFVTNLQSGKTINAFVRDDGQLEVFQRGVVE